jgi:hypothetical protein
MEGPPAKVNTKHELAALLLATGRFTVGEVADRVGLHVNGLARLRALPEFQQQVAGYQERLLEKALEKEMAVLDAVMGDAPKNLRFLTGTRDGEFEDDEKRMHVRLKAGLALFDRQAPKRVEGGEGGGVTVIINQDVVERAKRVTVEEEEFAE